MKNTPEQRYRAVFETTLRNGQVSASGVAGSKFFFELNADGTPKMVDDGPVPKRFDTYAIVCCLPFPKDFQLILQDYWKHFLTLLGNPVVYGVKPSNMHVEIFLFQRPEEVFTQMQVKAGIESSVSLAKELSSFTISFCYPFITPDGTIVIPGFESNGTIEVFRSKLKETLSAYPQKQSQWLHTSLGRILQPLDKDTMAPLLRDMEANWGKVVGEVSVDTLLWTWEKQWYMVDKEVLTTLDLSKHQ